VRWVRLVTNLIRFMDRTFDASEAWALKYMEGLHGREKLEAMYGAENLRALEAAADYAVNLEAGLQAAAAAAAAAPTAAN